MRWWQSIKTRRGKLNLGAMNTIRRRFFKYVRPHWRSLAIALGATFGAVAMNVAAPWPIKFVFDIVLDNKMGDSTVGQWFAEYAPGPTTALLIICGGIMLIALGQAGFAYMRDVILARTGQEVVGRLRHDLFRHMQKLSPDVFESRRTGDLLMRFTGDIQMLRQMIVNAWVTAAENLLTIAVTMLVMFWLNPRLAVLAMLTLPIAIWSAVNISKRIRHAAKSQREKESFVASIAHEVFGAIGVVQAFNRQKIELRRFARQNRSSIRAGVRTTKLESRLFRIVVLASATGVCMVLFVGVLDVLAGVMTAGDLLVFVAYVRSIGKPLRKMSKLASQTAKATVCGMRIAEMLNIKPAVKDGPDAISAEGIVGHIAVDNAGFTYPDGTPALHDVSFRIESGERVAVVGRSGAGKSTLMKLLLRFYDVSDGRIAFDDRDIREFTVASLRDQIAVVQQETVLFGLSIAENIAIGCESVDPIAVKKAAKQVGIHKFIRTLPQGYETKLAERGVTLSGGQRQRIALARALLRSAPILILDEPITGLDAESAQVLEDQVINNESRRTTLVICHDMSSMKQFDKIIVMDAGTAAAVGTHEELLDSCERYAKLYSTWFARSGTPGNSEGIDLAYESKRLAC